MKIEPFYDRTDLINVTTETVHENLLVGMALVTVILLMFLSNVRAALIVAINIPLALLFAFAVLLRARQVGQPAVHRRGRLRHHRRFLGHHGREHLPAHLTARRARGTDRSRSASSAACGEVEREPVLLDARSWSARFLPLFTMTGPGRADLRADGRHLRLRPGRCAAPAR